MSKLYDALVAEGKKHQGTELGRVLQWASLHIKGQEEIIEESKPTPDKMRAAIKRWHDAMDEADQHFAALIDLMGLSPDGATGCAVSGLQDALTHSTAELVGDQSGWLAWHFLENDMGRKKLKAASKEGQELREIATIDDLLWLLE